MAPAIKVCPQTSASTVCSVTSSSSSTTIGGFKTVVAGYADAIGSEGHAAAHGTLKNEVWVQVLPVVYVGGYTKVQLNKDGVEDAHDFQGAAGVKIPLLAL